MKKFLLSIGILISFIHPISSQAKPQKAVITLSPEDEQTYITAKISYLNKDYSTAYTAFEKLANKGNPDAQNHLAEMYFFGYGVPQDYKKAKLWIEKSAKQGNAFGQLQLGSLYCEGDGEPINYEKAVYWYRKSAEQNNATAQMRLANRYLNGQGVTKNIPLAKQWYKKSCDNGENKACDIYLTL